MKPLDLSGLWVPLVTPFLPDGSVDRRSLTNLGTRLLGDGVAGLVALGTTGEPATLMPEERIEVVEICGSISQKTGRPLIVGAGTNSTAGTLEEIRLLGTASRIDAALVVVPYYTRPSEAGLVEHFRSVADQSPVPIIIYNVPYRSGRGLGAEPILELSSHPNIVGLKQAVSALDRDTLEILRQKNSDFSVLAGDDAFIAPSLLMGGAGAIAASAHLCTGAFVAMADAGLAGRFDEVSRIAHQLLPVVDAGFAEPSPAVWKGALAEIGEITNGSLRRPMTEASIESVQRLVRAASAADSALLAP